MRVGYVFMLCQYGMCVKSLVFVVDVDVFSFLCRRVKQLVMFICK